MAGLLTKKKSGWRHREYTESQRENLFKYTAIKTKEQAYNGNMKDNIIYAKMNNFKYQEIEDYLKKIALDFDSVQIDKEKLSGMPVIKGTRIPVSLIVACFKDEMTIGEICTEYHITEEDVVNAMEYIIDILDTPYQEGI